MYSDAPLSPLPSAAVASGRHKLIAIQPAGAGGAYRIPARALDVFRRQSTRLRGRPGRPRIRTRVSQVSASNLYDEQIAPVLAATGLTADVLLRRMMTDQALVARYPSFATDYSIFVAEAVRKSATACVAAARTVDA